MTKVEDDVALKLLHTADWHLGKRFPGFDEGDQTRLSRARLEVVDRILLAADHLSVDAILCAGDLFDDETPSRDWWEPLGEKLSHANGQRPTFLLPGNHDPLVPGSVYHPDHPFRGSLPPWVHIVDRDDFEFSLNAVSTLYARPCRSKAGQDDPALALPARESGDDKIRIGLVHGSTFDAVNCQTNFPIARDAALRRGFDYLAVGDTHSFRNVADLATDPPVVYPGAPEPTSFGEPGAGNVVAVFVTRARKVRYWPERVARWQWSERHIDNLEELRALRFDPQLASYALRLIIDMSLSAPDLEEAETILRELKGTDATSGRAGIVKIVRHRLELNSRGFSESLGNLPDVLRAAVVRLEALEVGERGEVARAALFHLYQAVRETAP